MVEKTVALRVEQTDSQLVVNLAEWMVAYSVEKTVDQWVEWRADY